MIELSDRLIDMEESATIAMSKKSRELRAAGKDVISLSLGEPDFHTPALVKQAAIQAIHDNYTQYTPVAGYEDLRAAIAEKFKRDNNLDYSPSQIVVSTGAKQSIANVVLSIVNPGDEVIIPAPYWVSYIEMVKLAGGKPVVIATSIDSDFKISPEQLRAAITPKTKLFMFSSPCNPTGTVYSKEELHNLAQVFLQHPNVLVISDEIYEHIRFEGTHTSIASIDGMQHQTVTVNGVSKAWAMTGWRLGYIGAPLYIAQACDKVQGQFTSATSSISQRAAIAAVAANPSVISDMVRAFHSRRDLVLDGLSHIKGFKVNQPKGAFYVFPDVRDIFGAITPKGQIIQNGSDLCLYLLEEALVAIVPGEAFGDENCVRFSYATSEKVLTECLSRIHHAINALQWK